jgi:hypothetical protein
MQVSFNFYTGLREPGFVFIYTAAYHGKVIYVGQALDVVGRRSGHLQGDTPFDVFLRDHKNEVVFETIDKISDRAGGPVVSTRELELIDQYGTWIELGIGFNVRTNNTWKQLFADHFQHFQGTVDFRGGDGPFAAVRDCRRLHRKGEHWNWYRHRAYLLCPTLNEAQEDLSYVCQPLAVRSTERDVECDKGKHFVVHFFRDNDQWTTKRFGIDSEPADLPW